MSAYGYVSPITHGRPRWHAEGRSPLRGCDERPAHWTTLKTVAALQRHCEKTVNRPWAKGFREGSAAG
jgi:hypothetical protein